MPDKDESTLSRAISKALEAWKSMTEDEPPPAPPPPSREAMDEEWKKMPPELRKYLKPGEQGPISPDAYLTNQPLLSKPGPEGDPWNKLDAENRARAEMNRNLSQMGPDAYLPMLGPKGYQDDAAVNEQYRIDDERKLRMPRVKR